MKTKIYILVLLFLAAMGIMNAQMKPVNSLVPAAVPLK